MGCVERSPLSTICNHLISTHRSRIYVIIDKISNFFSHDHCYGLDKGISILK